MKVNKRSLVTVALVGLGLAASLMSGGTSAGADPAPGSYAPLAGVGSDTTQGVLNGLAKDIPAIASYDAVGSAQITTKDPNSNPSCTINRPNGSGAGVDALVASLAAGDGCIQFARSSSDNHSSYAGKGLTYVPFAIDAVAYAVRGDSTISKTLSTASLTRIYNCQGGANFVPLLPKYGSGTRKFFLSKLGFTDAANFTSTQNHTCISEVDATNAPLEENTGSLLTDPKQIVPYSIAVYLSQTSGTVVDAHGSSVLGQVDGVSPTVLNTASSFKREVFNVIPTAKTTGGTTEQATFVGGSSSVCQDTATIQKYGFAVDPNCGSTAIATS